MSDQVEKYQKEFQRTLIHAKTHAKLIFAGCENCRANCCDGRFRFAEVLLNEVQDSAKLFPVIFSEKDKEIELLKILRVNVISILNPI